MITLRAGEIWPELLSALTEPAEIINNSGEVLGQFVPNAERIQQLYAPTEHWIDPAELERRKADLGPRYTTRQVFEHLLTLTTDPAERAQLQALIDERTEREGCRTM